MRHPSFLLVPMTLAIAAFSCGDGKSTKAPVDDGGVAFKYEPAGCSYVVSPPTTRAYTDQTLDDATAALPSKPTPLRVRVGLGGGLESGKAGYADPSTTAAFMW
ncbi:hypothetical protein BH09MYX1_BH09MYX1_66430 [soil metagenome]